MFLSIFFILFEIDVIVDEIVESNDLHNLEFILDFFVNVFIQGSFKSVQVMR